MGIMRNLRMYASTQKYQWLAFFTYRLQAAVWIAVFALGAIVQIVTITVIYDVSSGISGWSYYQILALSGLSSMLTGVVLYNISARSIATRMRNGQLDQRLVKPYNPIVFMLSNSGTMSVSALGQIIPGFVIFAFSASMAGVPVLASMLLLLVFLLGAASLIMFILMLTLASYVLFRGAGYIQWLTNIAGRASSYPLNLYGFGGVVLLTIGLPVGLASFYPAEFIFGKLALYQFALVIALALASIFVYYRISSWLLTKYTSGGG
jgi:ABC-2 type transport system permease protein